MMKDENNQDVKAPDADQVKNTDKSVKMYSEEEFLRKVRGQGKVIDDLRSELDTIRAEKLKEQQEKERKELEAKGEYDSIVKKLESERDQYLTELSEFKKMQEERIGNLKESLKARIEAIPESMRDLVPTKLVDLDPDLALQHLTTIESKVAALQSNALKTGNQHATSNPPSSDDEFDSKYSAYQDNFFSKGGNK